MFWTISRKLFKKQKLLKNRHNSYHSKVHKILHIKVRKNNLARQVLCKEIIKCMKI